MRLRKDLGVKRGNLDVYRAQINGDSRFLKVQVILAFVVIILFLGWIMLSF